jgi:hypothetical protein
MTDMNFKEKHHSHVQVRNCGNIFFFKESLIAMMYYPFVGLMHYDDVVVLQANDQCNLWQCYKIQ